MITITIKIKIKINLVAKANFIEIGKPKNAN